MSNQLCSTFNKSEINIFFIIILTEETVFKSYVTIKIDFTFKEYYKLILSRCCHVGSIIFLNWYSFKCKLQTGLNKKIIKDLLIFLRPV
jgi:hypothetical protein